MNKSSFILLFGLLLLSTHGAVAQRPVASGSIRLSVQRPDMLLVEVSGLISFKESVQGGLLLGNLFPGDYRVKVLVQQRGRRTPNYIFDQNVRVQPGQSSIIGIDTGNRMVVSYTADPNSLMLCMDVRDHRHEPVLYPISDADLDKMLVALKRYAFDDDKLKILNASAPHHYYLSDQLGRIMTTFRDDDYKLRCAKTLIPRVLDPENLYLQVNVFTFNSNKDAYLNLIKLR